MTALVGEHAAQRRLNARVRARPSKMKNEVAIHATLEDLRQCQYLQQ